MITRSDIVSALSDAGMQTGMTVFSHANIAFFGRVEGAGSMDDLIRVMLDCFVEVLGPDGTIIFPVFTYSFGSDKDEKVFDLQHSLSATSGMGNWLISSGTGARSADPMLSVIAVGGKAEALTHAIDPICFGPDSIWARLHAEDGLICNLNLDSGSTYLHWIEREAGVSYRSDIPMSGTIIDQDKACAADIIYSGRALDDPQAVPKFEAYHTASLEHGISKRIALGRGQIVAQKARDAKGLLTELLQHNPYIMTAGHIE